MNCQSCGAILPSGVAHCPWCNTPTMHPQSFGSGQFASPTFSPQSPRPPQPSYPLHSPHSPHPPQIQPSLQSISQTRQFQPAQTGSPPHSSYVSHVEQKPKKRRGGGSIIFFSLLFLVIITVTLVGTYFARKEVATIHNTVTTVTQQLDNPTGYSISPPAAIILSHTQIASKIDTTLAPVQIASSFTTGQHIYVTFHIDSKGQDGTIQARWYAEGKVVAVSAFHHAHENMQGLVSYVYAVPAKVGVVALFWCLKQDCSDAQLAVVLHFTVIVGAGPVVSIQSQRS